MIEAKVILDSVSPAGKRITTLHGEDLALFERLAGGTPIHASPLEHQGLAMEHPRRRSRNFVGWWQFRELFEERSMA